MAVLTFGLLVRPAYADFGAKTDFSVGDVPRSLLLADLNGDGKLDIVTANQGDDNVSVRLNTTPPGEDTPTFGAEFNFDTGDQCRTVAVADLNGDGRPDIVTGNAFDGNTTVLLNETPPGSDTPDFSAAAPFLMVGQPFSVALADVNGDGRPDIATANGFTNASVRLNETAPGAPAPDFDDPGNFTMGDGPGSVAPVSVALVDLNNDGRPDLITANESGNTVAVRLNETAPGATDPSFGTRFDFGMVGNPRPMALADLNGDGRMDIVTGNPGADSASVLLNTTPPGTTTPTFGTRGDFPVGNSPFGVALADLNGDGRPDIVTANSDSDNVSVLLNTTTPGAVSATFGSSTNFLAGNGAHAVALGDLNGDGRPDIAVSNDTDDDVSVLLNTTTGSPTPSFIGASPFSVQLQPAALALADVNNDGRLDLIATNQTPPSASVLLNEMAPGATTPDFGDDTTFTVGAFASSMALADLNGDGRRDIVTADTTSPSASVLFNETPPGSTATDFSDRTPLSVGSAPRGVALADVNGDGRRDIIIANEGGSVNVRLNATAPGAATPTFTGPTPFTVSTQIFDVAVADMNGDGKLDVITANTGSDNVSVLLNETAPGVTTPDFATHQDFPTGNDPFTVAVADINGDGKPDIVTGHFGDANASVLLNETPTGATTLDFSAKHDFGLATSSRSVALADMNGDGKIDIVAINRASTTVSLLLNATTPGATTPNFLPKIDLEMGVGMSRVKLADLNGDGWKDIAVVHTTGSVNVRLQGLSPGTLQFAGATSSVDEGVGTATVQVTRTGGSTSAVSATVTITGGTAAVPGDASLATATVFFDNNESGTKSVSLVTIVNDTIADSGETVEFTLSAPAGGATLGTQTVHTLTINDTDAPIVSTTAGSLPYAENQIATAIDTNVGVTDADSANLASATIQITGDYQNGQDVLACPACVGLGISAAFAPASGTLTLGNAALVASYQTALRSVTYQNSSDSPAPATRIVSFSVTDAPSNNASNVAARGITLTTAVDVPIVTPTAGSLAYTENQAATAIDSGVTVTDADSANAASATVQITSNYQNGQDVLACPSCAGLGISATFAPASGTLTLGNAALVASYQTALQSVTYQNTSENPSTLARTVTYQVTDVPSSTLSATATRGITVTAVNDPPVALADTVGALANATTTIAAPGVLANDTDPDSLSFTAVKVTDPANGTVTLQANGGFSYTPTSGFTGTDSFTYKPNDGALDGNTVTVTLAVGASVLTIDDVTVTEGDAGTKVATFTVTLTPASTSQVTVQVQTQDGTATVAGGDYVAVPLSTLTFGIGEVTKPVTVTITGDTVIEPNETYSLLLSNPTAAIVAKGTGAGAITNDDSAGTIQFSAATASVPEAAGKATLTVTRTSGNAPVSVQLATANGTALAGQDYTALTTTVSFGAGETSKTVDVVVVSDVLPEADETFTATLSNPQGGATLGATTTAAVTIVDNDAEPTIGAASATASGAEGTNVVVTVTLSHPSARPISVSFATRDGTAQAPIDYTPVSGTLVFAPGETSKTIVVPLLADGLFESDETLTLVLSTPTVSGAGTTGARSTPGQSVAPSGSVVPGAAPAAPPITAQAGQPVLGISAVTITILNTNHPPATNDPNNDDERGGNNEARGADENETEDDRRQAARTNRGNRDDEHIEGDVLEVHLDDPSPYIVIGTQDGPAVIRLKRRASFPEGIKVGDYAEIDGEKEHEQLFWADDVEIKRR